MNKYILITSVVFLLFLISCSKKRECKKEDSFSGIVVSQFEGNPMYEGEVGNHQFIITEDSIYQKEKEENMPEIDFSKYSLLGQLASGSCNIRFHRDVQSDNNTETYYYKLTVYECFKFTKKERESLNWIVVPKIPQGWTVTFEQKIID